MKQKNVSIIFGRTLLWNFREFFYYYIFGIRAFQISEPDQSYSQQNDEYN